MKDNKKGFYKSINIKRKIGAEMGPLLNVVGELVTSAMEMAEVLSAFFASVFTRKTILQEKSGTRKIDPAGGRRVQGVLKQTGYT